MQRGTTLSSFLQNIMNQVSVSTQNAVSNNPKVGVLLIPHTKQIIGRIIITEDQLKFTGYGSRESRMLSKAWVLSDPNMTKELDEIIGESKDHVVKRRKKSDSFDNFLDGIEDSMKK